ncbi:MAG: WYL domain-containing protein, partial [Niameybacter sp.]
DTYKPVDEKFEKIKEGILTRRVISFEYMNSSGEKAIRKVCPLKLFYKGQAWYLKGYCKQKEAHRIFKISRIKKYSILEETFDRGKLLQGMNQEEHTPNLESINLTLRFKEEVLYLLYDSYEDKQMTRNEDGTYTVKTSFPKNEWVYFYILSFGSFVEVIEPIQVRK